MGKKTKILWLIFALFFHFSFFSISHSSVIHREIFVKDFSGTTAPRILKFGTNVGYDLLHCVRENQPPGAYHFLYLFIFLSLQSNFLLQISRLLWEPGSSNFVYTLRMAKYIVGQKTKMLRFIFTIFFHFSIFHSKVIHMEVVSKISQELLRRGLWNLVQMLGMTCCIVLKRICLLLLIIPFICPFFFLSSKTFHHRILRSYYSQSLQILYTPWEGQVYCGKENQDSVINICLIFPFFLFFHLSLQCNT